MTLYRGPINSSQTEIFTLNANAGDQFSFVPPPFTTVAPDWQLLDPLGQVIFNASLGTPQKSVVTPISGIYTLLVEGDLSDDTIPLSYEFTTTLLDNNPHAPSNWRLKGPGIDGVIPVDSYKYNLLPGSYQLTVDGNGAGTGFYSLRVLDLAVATKPPLGANQPGTLKPAASTVAYKFNVTAGNQFYFDNRTTTPNNTYWRLVSPTGVEIFNSPLSSGDIDTRTLTQTGFYTLLIEGSLGETIETNFEFNVQPVAAAVPEALILGSETSGSIAVPGGQEIYGLTLASPATLHFDSLSSIVVETARIQGPGIDQAFSLSEGSVPAQALLAGNYQLIIDGNGNSTGAYSFCVRDLPTATALAFATQVTTTLSPSTETDLYKFNAVAGDRFTFDSSTANPLNAQWRLLNPQGQTVFTAGLALDQVNVSLPVAGTYTLLIEGASSDAGTVNYSFRVNFLGNTPPTPFTGTPLLFDT